MNGVSFDTMVSLCTMRLGPRAHSPLGRVSKTTEDEYGFLPWQTSQSSRRSMTLGRPERQHSERHLVSAPRERPIQERPDVQRRLASPLDERPDVQRRLVSPIQERPDVQRRLASPIRERPDVQRRLASPLDERPDVQRRLVSPIQERPDVQRRLANPIRERPDVQRRLASPIQERPDVQRRLASPIQERPDVQRRLASPIRERPDVQRRLASPIQERHDVQRRLASPIQERPAVQRRLASPIQERPDVQRRLASPIQERPDVQRRLASPIQERPDVQRRLARPLQERPDISHRPLPRVPALRRRETVAGPPTPPRRDWTSYSRTSSEKCVTPLRDRTEEQIYERLKTPSNHAQNTSVTTSTWSDFSDVTIPVVHGSDATSWGTPLTRSQSVYVRKDVPRVPPTMTSSASSIPQPHSRDVTRSQSMTKARSEFQPEVVSFPEYTPMVITQSYDPSRDPGVSGEQLLNSCVRVTRGEIVSAISRRGKSILVQTFTGRFGYVPASCVHPVKAILRKCRRDFSQQYPDPFFSDRSDPPNPDHSLLTDVTALSGSFSTDSGLPDSSPSRDSSGESGESGTDNRDRNEHSSILRQLRDRPPRIRRPLTPASTPIKDPSYPPSYPPVALSPSSSSSSTSSRPKLTVLFKYDPVYDGDVTVRHQDVVTLLSDDDSKWLYIQTSLGRRGYIPRTHAIDLTSFNLDPSAKTTYL